MNEYKSVRFALLHNFFTAFCFISLINIMIYGITFESITGIHYGGEIFINSYIRYIFAPSLFITWFINEQFFKITMRVSDEGISFIKRGKAYRTLLFGDYEFDSKIETVSHNFVFWATFRYINVYPKHSVSKKSYACHNFSRKTFESLIADINSRIAARGLERLKEYEQIEQGEYKTTETLYINRKKALLPYIKMLFIGAILPTSAVGLYAIFNSFVNYYGDSGELFKTEYVIFAVLIILTVIIYFFSTVMPFYRAVKTTVRKEIAVLDDRIEIDGVKFFYEDMRDLKLTNPYCFLKNNKSKTLREIIIEDRTGTFKFMLGGNLPEHSAISAEDYVFLYTRLLQTVKTTDITEDLKPRKMFWFL